MERMTIDEFQKKSYFSREEITAYAQGDLLTNAPNNLPALPNALLIAFHEVTRIEWDPKSKTGRIEAVRYNRLDDWFYACHFLGDPVMPGCWGIDAAWQCLKFFAAWKGLVGCDKTLGMDNVSFFGQIRPYDKKITYTVDILSIEESDGEYLITGKASVAVDDMAVYTIGTAQVGTSFWDSAHISRPHIDVPAATPDAPFDRKLSYDEFTARNHFSQAELIAFSSGTLVNRPPVEMSLLPSSLMLEVSQVHEFTYDAATGGGHIVASKQNTSWEWFYPMNQRTKPTVLAIDAIWQLLGMFLVWRKNAGTGRALGFERVEVFDTVKPSDKRILYQIEILKTARSETTGDVFVRGDAKVFADGRPILTCANANVGCHKNICYANYPVRSDMGFGGTLKTHKTGTAR